MKQQSRWLRIMRPLEMSADLNIELKKKDLDEVFFYFVLLN